MKLHVRQPVIAARATRNLAADGTLAAAAIISFCRLQVGDPAAPMLAAGAFVQVVGTLWRLCPPTRHCLGNNSAAELRARL